MSLNTIKRMLKELSYFEDCEISHTFTRNRLQILSVSYFKETKTYEITFIDCLNTVKYGDIDSAAIAIHNAINNSPQKTLSY